MSAKSIVKFLRANPFVSTMYYAMHVDDLLVTFGSSFNVWH